MTLPTVAMQVERSRALGFPFMAGSSLVTCHRAPYLEHPLECPTGLRIAQGWPVSGWRSVSSMIAYMYIYINIAFSY